MKFCPECGNKLIPGAKFCPECGVKLSNYNQEVEGNDLFNSISDEKIFETNIINQKDGVNEIYTIEDNHEANIPINSEMEINEQKDNSKSILLEPSILEEINLFDLIYKYSYQDEIIEGKKIIIDRPVLISNNLHIKDSHILFVNDEALLVSGTESVIFEKCKLSDKGASNYRIASYQDIKDDFIFDEQMIESMFGIKIEETMISLLENEIPILSEISERENFTLKAIESIFEVQSMLCRSEYLDIEIEKSTLNYTYPSYISNKSIKLDDVKLNPLNELKKQTFTLNTLFNKTIFNPEQKLIVSNSNFDLKDIKNYTLFSAGDEETVFDKVKIYNSEDSFISNTSYNNNVKLNICEFYKCKEILPTDTEVNHSKYVDCENIFRAESRIEDTTFINCNDIFNHDTEVKSSKFEGCKNVFNSDFDIQSCDFTKCEEIADGINAQINKCSFNNIVSFGKVVALDMRDSIFENITYSENKQSMSALIKIQLGSSKSDSIIKKCTFKNINIVDGGSYIISSGTFINRTYPPITVEECIFENCSTPSGAIRETDYYFPRFSRNAKLVKMIDVSNNKGL